MQPFLPATVELGKSDTYLRTFPASIAATTASSSKSWSLAMLIRMTPFFIMDIAFLPIMCLVESRSGTWIVMKSQFL